MTAAYVSAFGPGLLRIRDSESRSPISPFAPEASVPLPFQLGEQGLNNFGSSVWKRNERERYRVRCVNEGYERLRNHLPLGDDKRISKVDTLRMAIQYIRHLERLLANARHQRHCFCFQQFSFPSSTTPVTSLSSLDSSHLPL